MLPLSGLLAAGLVPLTTLDAQATKAYADKEKKKCEYCHLKPNGGGKRGFRGIYYNAHSMSFKGYVEAEQAKKAGVKPNAVGRASKPTKPYKG